MQLMNIILCLPQILCVHAVIVSAAPHADQLERDLLQRRAQLVLSLLHCLQLSFLSSLLPLLVFFFLEGHTPVSSQTL